MKKHLFALALALAASGCAVDTGASLPNEEDLLGVGPVSIAEFPQGFQIHSVAGDTALLFAVQPSDAPGRARGVHVARRLDGLSLTDVTPPDEGWATPLSVIVQSFERSPLGSSGVLIVLDAGVTPANVGQAPARLYRYAYHYRPLSGLSTTLTETHLLPLNTQPSGAFPNGIVYPGAPAILPSGQIAVADSLVGSIWLSDASLSTWTMALIDPRLGAAPGLPVAGVGLDHSGHISPYTYAAPPFPGLPPGFGLYPGVHSEMYVEATDEVCLVVTASPGGIYCIAHAALVDLATPPFAKTFRTLVPPTPGVSDLTDGLAYDHYAPTSPWLYWERAPADVIGGGCNAIRRVNVHTGSIELLACDNHVLSWANEISVLPPLVTGSPLTTLLLSVGQQYNNPDVNAAITTPSYFSPSRMPIFVTTNH